MSRFGSEHGTTSVMSPFCCVKFWNGVFRQNKSLTTYCPLSRSSVWDLDLDLGMYVYVV